MCDSVLYRKSGGLISCNIIHEDGSEEIIGQGTL